MEKNVNYINYKSSEDQIQIIKTIIEQYKENEYNTIAIICKNEEEAIFINSELKKENIITNNITDSDTQYKGGICT